MAVSPENRLGLVRNIVRWVKRDPVYAVGQTAILLTAGTVNLWMPKAGEVIATIPFVRAMNEEGERNRQTQEAARQAQQDVLRKDFEETDGVDRMQTAQQSWLLTITRPSSTFGGSTQEILGRVTERIADETGCQSIVIAEAVVDRSSGWFYTPKPTVYSVAATDCP